MCIRSVNIKVLCIIVQSKKVFFGTNNDLTDLSDQILIDETSYGHLSVSTLYVLCENAVSEAAVERSFYRCKFVHTRMRANLEDRTMDIRLFIRYN